MTDRGDRKRLAAGAAAAGRPGAAAPALHCPAGQPLARAPFNGSLISSRGGLAPTRSFISPTAAITVTRAGPASASGAKRGTEVAPFTPSGNLLEPLEHEVALPRHLV